MQTQKQSLLRPATTNEVKALVSGFNVIVSAYQASAGLFLIDLNGIDEAPVLKAMKVTAMQAGYIFEHIMTIPLYGRPTMEIRVRVRNNVNATEPVYAGRMVIRKPTNFDLEPKPKRLAHMKHFIEVREFTRIQFEGAESAFVGRLFDEGMLERNPDNINEMRPTPEGVRWYMAHTGK